MSINFKILISKLDDICCLVVECVVNLCMLCGNYEVDLEYLFLVLLEQLQSDFVLIVCCCGIVFEVLECDLFDEISQFKIGNSCMLVFLQYIFKLFEYVWLIVLLDLEISCIWSGYLLLVLMIELELLQLVYCGFKLFVCFKVDVLKYDFVKFIEGLQEVGQIVCNVDVGVGEGDFGGEIVVVVDGQKGGLFKILVLDQFIINFIECVCEDCIDLVIGCDVEICQVIDILMCCCQNNLIFIGEVGVGKIVVVEGLVWWIVGKDVFDVLLGVELYILDMGLLQVGVSVKGEFENCLKNVIDEVKKSLYLIILFIDEVYIMIGVGGIVGQNDVVNLFKLVLVCGELCIIVVIIWSEYKKYFEKDVVLVCCFQVVKVEEFIEVLVVVMLCGMVGLMEVYFNIWVMDEVVIEVVWLLYCYISGCQLLDKVVSVFDIVCVKVVLGQSVMLVIIEDICKYLDCLVVELLVLEWEIVGGVSYYVECLGELCQLQVDVQVVLVINEVCLISECVLVDQICVLCVQMEVIGLEVVIDVFGVVDKLVWGRKVVVSVLLQQIELDCLFGELCVLQGEILMVFLQVDGGVVVEIVLVWIGVLFGCMVKDEICIVCNFGGLLVECVIGQDYVLEVIVQCVCIVIVKLEDLNKLCGVFMFVGFFGVGKIEIVLVLVDILYGGECKLIIINMSEYQEVYSVFGLKGLLFGYVGYGEGGVLIEVVCCNLYSVVLLDEVEKVYLDVLEMFFQVFDKGQMDDVEGCEIDFCNMLIIFMFNIGFLQIMQVCLNKFVEEMLIVDVLGDVFCLVLMKSFKFVFLGCMKVVLYFLINDDVLVQIIVFKFGCICDCVVGNYKVMFLWDDSLVEVVLLCCIEVDFGVCNVDYIFNGMLLLEIVESVLVVMVEGNWINVIKVIVGKNGVFKYKLF